MSELGHPGNQCPSERPVTRWDIYIHYRASEGCVSPSTDSGVYEPSALTCWESKNDEAWSAAEKSSREMEQKQTVGQLVAFQGHVRASAWVWKKPGLINIIHTFQLVWSLHHEGTIPGYFTRLITTFPPWRKQWLGLLKIEEQNSLSFGSSIFRYHYKYLVYQIFLNNMCHTLISIPSYICKTA